MAGIAILSAYLFCTHRNTHRKWVGTAISYFWDHDPNISYLVQILVTLPLLWLILKYVAPYLARLKYESPKILRFFIIVPLLYYILEYSLTVYTDLLYQGGCPHCRVYGCGCGGDLLNLFRDLPENSLRKKAG